MSCSFETVEFVDDHRACSLLVDKNIYSKQAVIKACYWFANKLTFQLQDQDRHLKVTLRVRSPLPSLEAPRPPLVDDYLPDFFNALIDAQLREEVNSETAGMRDLIIAKAFAEAGVLEDLPPGTFENGSATSEDQGSDLINIRTDLPGL